MSLYRTRIDPPTGMLEGASAQVPRTSRRALRAAIAASLFVALADGLRAQELEPALYQNAPVGLNAALVSYGFSRGNILIDSSLPIEDFNARVHTVALGYVRTLGVFSRSAKLDLQAPVSWALFQGTLAGEHRTRSPSGLADPRVRFMVNFVGAPPLAGQDFAAYRQGTVLGAGIQVAVPLGQYDPARLINLGSNRWAFRPEIGLSRKQGRIFFELATGAWMFTRNSDFYGATTLSQEPLFFVKGNLIYNFKRRGTWLSLNYGRATGGETTVGGVAKQDIQTNDRVAATLALPLARTGSLRLIYTNGLSTRLGADFDSWSVAYQRTWGGRGRPRPSTRTPSTDGASAYRLIVDERAEKEAAIEKLE